LTLLKTSAVIGHSSDQIGPSIAIEIGHSQPSCKKAEETVVLRRLKRCVSIAQQHAHASAAIAAACVDAKARHRQIQLSVSVKISHLQGR
jgi:hypothetical protein